jgi:hypothetical protein
MAQLNITLNQDEILQLLSTVVAIYFKVRENHRIISKALMIAFATNDEGHR